MVAGKAASAEPKRRQEPPSAGTEKVLGAPEVNGATIVYDGPTAPAAPGAPPDNKPEAPPPPEPAQEPERPQAKAAEPEFEETIEITRQTEMGMKTLRGDIQLAIMNEIIKRNFLDTWEKFSEHLQQRVIDAVRMISTKLVHEAVRLAKLDGTEPFEMTINNFTVDPEKGIVAKIVMPRDDDTLVAVNDALGKTGYFIPLNAADFLGERRTMVPDNVGELGIPKLKNNGVIPGHAIKMDVDETGEAKMSVASCECGWASKLPVGQVEQQGPLIKAHLAEAQLGRGPVDDKGNPIKADPASGEIVEETTPPGSQQERSACDGDPEGGPAPQPTGEDKPSAVVAEKQPEPTGT